MKVPITDEFLWDVYNFLSEAGYFLGSMTKYPTMHNWLPGPSNPIFKKYRKEQGARKFGKLIYYLKRKGYIKIKSLENKPAIILTKEGISKALKASFKLNKKKRKDRKWVMLIFDIPQNYKKARSLLRSILKNFGYKMFQQSVWITPYDVSEETENLLQIYSLDSYIRIFLIEEL
jgi:hypothetical protein